MSTVETEIRDVNVLIGQLKPALASQPKDVEALELITMCQSVVVADEEDHAYAQQVVQRIQSRIKTIEEHDNPVCKALDAIHKFAVQRRDELIKPLRTGRQIIEGKIIAYRDRREREAEIERAQLEEARRREREALAVEVADLAVQRGVSQDEAADLMTAVLAEPASEITDVRAYATASGVSKTRYYYGARVENLELLVLAWLCSRWQKSYGQIIVEITPGVSTARLSNGQSIKIQTGQVPDDAIAANEAALNNAARAHKELFDVPGVRVVKRSSLGVRG